MKIKNVMILVLATLVITSFSASGLNINSSLKTQNNDIDVYVGEITVNCEYDDDLAVEVDVEESPHRDIDPQGSEKVTFRFYLEWHIRNQQALNFDEKWYFEIVLREGGTPSSPVIDEKTLTVNDGILGPEKTDGKLYSGEISIGRSDFEKDDFFNEPETKKFRAEIRGVYYHNGGQKTIDDDNLWTNTRIDLGNERPTKPTLTGNIEDGEQGSYEETYTFTASGSTDSDGDEIIHYGFDFHDGTVENVKPSGGTAQASHKWDSQGEKKVSVYAFDRFGAMSDGAEMTFTLPKDKSKNIEKSDLNEILRQSQFLKGILEKINF